MCIRDSPRITWRNGFGPWTGDTPVLWDPSKKAKIAFAAKVRAEMEEYGLTFPFFEPGDPMIKGGLTMEGHYFVHRPPSHYKPDGVTLKDKAPEYPRRKDIDNLDKFVLDALQGIIYFNDSMVRKSITVKSYTLGHGYIDMEFTHYR